MTGIRITGLSKAFDDAIVLKEMDLEVEAGEFLVLLGPSGCGKTTTLRCVAGLETPNAGEITLEDRVVFSRDRGIDVPAKDRSIGFVFQSYALYPHMDVFRNVGFGLSVRHVPKELVQQRVGEALRMVDLEGMEHRLPRQLSGGQRQRVAVARVVASKPSTLLFDEPLSNVDPVLRADLRMQLKTMHRRLGAASIYVTHDVSEAMTLADRIAVMVKGTIVQVGTGEQIYRFPETPAVAEITGEVKTNLIEGEVHLGGDQLLLVPKDDPYCFIHLGSECAPFVGRNLIVHVRPEDVEVARTPRENEGRLKVLACMPLGMETQLHLRFGERQGQLIARLRESDGPKIAPGQAVGVRLRRGNLYDAESQNLVGSFGLRGELPARSG